MGEYAGKQVEADLCDGEGRRIFRGWVPDPAEWAVANPDEPLAILVPLTASGGILTPLMLVENPEDMDDPLRLRFDYDPVEDRWTCDPALVFHEAIHALASGDRDWSWDADARQWVKGRAA